MRALCWPNDSQRSSSTSCCTSRPSRCIVGLGSRPGTGLERPDFVGGRARRLQLAGGQRLFRRVQQAMHLLPHGLRLLLRGPNLREPPLLDHRQRGFEPPRQLRRAGVLSSACQRSGSCALSMDVPAASCSASTTSASRAGQRLQFLRPTARYAVPPDPASLHAASFPRTSALPRAARRVRQRIATAHPTSPRRICPRDHSSSLRSNRTRACCSSARARSGPGSPGGRSRSARGGPRRRS